ncbi:MAG: helix-turn-helix transcriptional regulator [Chloroflexi bacterium]|nr:helix-turn-helix transcriptional regulator [Chloroflexota bacterium]
MGVAAKDPESYLPLTESVFHILLALTDKERHGYGIMQEVKRRTKGKVKLGPGTLYGSIKRLLEGKWIEESTERPDPAINDERRRYYRLSELGKRIAAAEARRIVDLVHQAREKKLLPDEAVGKLV